TANIDNQTAEVLLHSRADFRLPRGVDPDAPVFDREHYGRGIMGEAVSFPYRLDKLRHSWSARFPLFAAGLSDEFVKARGDKRRGVDLAITFHRRAEQLRYARQNFDGAIFGVAAE